jgi:hypothetical protein
MSVFPTRNHIAVVFDDDRKPRKEAAFPQGGGFLLIPATDELLGGEVRRKDHL